MNRRLCSTAIVVWMVFLLWGSGCATGWRDVRAKEGAAKSTDANGQGSGETEVPDLDRRSDAYARFASGIVYDLRDQPQKADESFLKSVAIDPANEDLVIELSHRLLVRRQTDEAVKLLVRAAARPGADGSVYAWLGLAETQKGDPTAAMAAYRIALQKTPNSLLACHGLAQLLLDQKQPAEALQVIDRAAALPNEDAGFLVGLAEFLLTNMRGKGLKPEEVKPRIVELLRRAAETMPTDPSTLHRMANTYRTVGELNSATVLYRQLLDQHQVRNPAMAAVLREQLIQLYFLSGQKAEAAAQLREVLQSNPTNPRVHFTLGSLALEDRKPAEAAASYERAVMLDPNFEPAYYELALAQVSMGQPDKALATLEQARGRFKTSFVMEFYAGVAAAAAKEYSEALKAFMSAELLARATEPSRLNHGFYFQFGAAAERAGNIVEGERLLRRSLELAPDDPETLNYLGYMLADRGEKLDEAHELIARALKAEPDSAAILDSFAWVLFKQNKAAEALPVMLRAIERTEKPDATLFDHLGDIYSALGQTNEARAAWQKSLAVEPSEAIQKKLDGANH